MSQLCVWTLATVCCYFSPSTKWILIFYYFIMTMKSATTHSNTDRADTRCHLAFSILPKEISSCKLKDGGEAKDQTE